MPKLPQIRSRQIERVLIKLDFVPRPGKGSHVVFMHSDGRRTVVPGHRRPVRVGTLRAILDQAKITLEEFLNHLK